MAENDTVLKQIRHSISHSPVRQGTDKTRRRTAFNDLMLHIHPRKVPLEALCFSHTFGLGGMYLVLFLLLALNGALLLFVYQPFPGKAYFYVKSFQTEVMFGLLVRNSHYWSANFAL